MNCQTNMLSLACFYVSSLLHSAWPQIAAGCHLHEEMGPESFPHEA